MFDIGFSELLVIGVVALIVIGPERLPRVARTVGHLYGRMQRYVTSVKSDISREIQLDELRRAGETLKSSVESAASGVEQQATVVDDYLRKETGNVTRVMEAMGTTEGERPVTAPAMQQLVEEQTPQQNLPLDEPAAVPATVVETAHGTSGDKSS
jgi:sec-independent protein translocase protein TatB